MPAGNLGASKNVNESTDHWTAHGTLEGVHLPSVPAALGPYSRVAPPKQPSNEHQNSSMLSKRLPRQPVPRWPSYNDGSHVVLRP